MITKPNPESHKQQHGILSPSYTHLDVTKLIIATSCITIPPLLSYQRVAEMSASFTHCWAVLGRQNAGGRPAVYQAGIPMMQSLHCSLSAHSSVVAKPSSRLLCLSAWLNALVLQGPLAWLKTSRTKELEPYLNQENICGDSHCWPLASLQSPPTTVWSQRLEAP
jgi:hypothetical protein